MRPFRPQVMFALATVFMLPAVSHAQQDLSHIRRILDASKTTSFAGIRRVTVKGRDDRPTTFSERVLKSGDKWQISYPDDSPFAGQRVYEVGSERFTYNGATNEVRVSPSRIQQELDGLRYWLEPGSSDRTVSRFTSPDIAGRTVVGLRLTSGRGPTMEVCFDRAKGSILKWTTLDSKGRVIAGFEYDSITFDVKISPREFVPPRGAKIVRLTDELRTVCQGLGMRPYTIPESTGYRLLSVSKFQHDDNVGYRQFFSKGESRVSLFVLKGSAEFGRQSGRMQVYKWQKDGNTFVLVGSHSADELRRLAQAVRS